MEKEEQKIPIKEDKNQKIQCEICGSIYYRKNKARHIQTDKCKRAKYIWCDRFEIKR